MSGSVQRANRAEPERTLPRRTSVAAFTRALHPLTGHGRRRAEWVAGGPGGPHLALPRREVALGRAYEASTREAQSGGRLKEETKLNTTNGGTTQSRKPTVP